eukprot:165779_1
MSSKKRKLTDAITPNAKKQKISASPNTKESTIQMSNNEFLSLLIQTTNKNQTLSDIMHIVIYDNDNKDYDKVFHKYLKGNQFESLFPNLKTIELSTKFLFKEYIPPYLMDKIPDAKDTIMRHSKLEQIIITDCTVSIDISNLIYTIKGYPSLKSIHSYYYFYHANINEQQSLEIKQGIENIILFSHLRT